MVKKQHNKHHSKGVTYSKDKEGVTVKTVCSDLLLCRHGCRKNAHNVHDS